MPEGWEEAMKMAERYQDYFMEHDADIALGRSGTHFFYVYDRKHGCFEVFETFHTAAELEELILGTLVENLECMNAVMAEELHAKFELAGSICTRWRSSLRPCRSSVNSGAGCWHGLTSRCAAGCRRNRQEGGVHPCR